MTDNIVAAYPTKDAAEAERSYWASELTTARRRIPQLNAFGIAVRYVPGAGWAIVAEPLAQAQAA